MITQIPSEYKNPHPYKPLNCNIVPMNWDGSGDDKLYFKISFGYLGLPAVHVIGSYRNYLSTCHILAEKLNYEFHSRGPRSRISIHLDTSDDVISWVWDRYWEIRKEIPDIRLY